MAWELEIRASTDSIREALENEVNRRHRHDGRPVLEILQDADIVAMVGRQKVRRLRYIGKPNRYRALQAQRFLQRRPNEVITKHLEVEFDRGGLLYSRLNASIIFDKVNTAYHPHSGTMGPIDGFSRRAYAKRVGGLTLYSYKDKLPQEEIDMFYQWFEKAFKKRLKRPKGRALGMKDLGNLGPEGEQLAF